MGKKINAPGLVFVALLMACFTGSTTAFSQDSTHISKPVLVHVSLLYDFPQSYGLAAGFQYPFKAIIKNRISRNGNVFTRHKDRFWGLEAAAYRYPFNYTGILLVPTFGVRRYVHNSFFYETSLGVGVLRTFYDGKVYEVDASGNIHEKPFFGRFYATTHVSAAFNFLLRKQHEKILDLQIKPSLWFQYPFDSFIKPHISVEAGIKYEISKRSIKTRKTVKYLKK